MDTVNETDSLAVKMQMLDTLEAIAELPKDESHEFMRALSMLGSCFLNKKNHGVFLLVENEEMLKVMGVNSTMHETGHIVTQAAEMFITNLHASDLHRRGETH